MATPHFSFAGSARKKDRFGSVAQKTKVDGYTFDSKAEAVRYCELKLLLRAGEISELSVHPRYELLATFKHPLSGETVRSIFYESDFTYKNKKGSFITEDVKGVRTKDYIIKRKLFQRRFPDILHVELGSRRSAR